MGHLYGERPASFVTRERVPIPRSRSVPILVITLVALIASCGGPAPSGPSRPTMPASSPYGVETPNPSESQPTAVPEPQAWTKLSLPASVEVARLEPTIAGPAGLAVDTAFRLTSLDGRPPAALAARLVAEPPIAFKVASTDGASAVVRPSAALQTRTAYRISLTRGDGSVEATWAAQTAGPLRVVETIPDNEATRVPRDTGIEITFDQAGVAPDDLASHFKISPATSGRFEAAGRTIAFVPSKTLAAGHLYTVTVRHGLPLAGTGQVLGSDVVFRFETRAGGTSALTLSFARSLVEANPRERPTMTVFMERRNDRKPPASIPITVHRLPTMDAAIGVWNTIRESPSWTVASTTAPVSTTGLARAMKANVRLHRTDDDAAWIELPARLPAGWYLVTETWHDVPRQTVLQVTDLASFSMLTTTRSAFWVNDLATGKAVSGASVTLGGRRLGTTDARGLLVATTPRVAKTGETPWKGTMAVVRSGSRSAFEPVYAEWFCGTCAVWPTVTTEWWHMFTSDRYEYRPTDTINAWGVLRDRDTGKVPASVTISLRAETSEDESLAPIMVTNAAPNASGMFTARLAFSDLPVGEYRLELRSGETQVGELWLRVATIVKPAYQLTVTTDRHALINGDSVSASVDAAFFEGTPVAGTEVSLGVTSDDEDEGSARDSTATATTDAVGHASAPLTVRIGGNEQWQVARVHARPTLAEEAGISAGSDVTVFRSSAILDAEATRSGTRLVVTGSVNDVAFDRFETAQVSPWDVDPRGPGRAGATVNLRIVEIRPVRRQTGTEYDFVTKRVVPTYDYSQKSRTVARLTVRTGPDGTFRLQRTVTGGDRSYEVHATYVDEASRSIGIVASAETAATYARSGAWLEPANAGHDDGTYSVGDMIRVRFVGGVENAPVARYLYTTTQRGLRYATVGSTSTFRTTFTDALVPNVQVSAVRFNGYGYDLAVYGWQASLRPADRKLTVEIGADRTRYSPGDAATVSIRTLDPDGAPVAASVLVTVIDEKLYAMGAAGDADPLSELYGEVDAGIIAWSASHRTPADDYRDGKGDTTGGGEGDGGRSDFRDWLVARIVMTGADGRTSVPVQLSDDLTSWHVSASAVDGALDAGIGNGLLQVGLPFFAEATIAPEYLVSDRPVIRVRGFGAGLSADDTVTFTVRSDTLPMSDTTASAKAFQAAEVPLPALSLGTQRIRISATVGSGDAARTDVLTRTFRVVQSRATRLETTWAPLESATGVAEGTGLTHVTLVDAGRGRVVPVLDELAWTSGGRSDLLLAAALANRVLVDEFGLPAATPTSAAELDPYLGLYEGLPIVPWGSANLDVTALAAMTGDPHLDASRLDDALSNVLTASDERRDRKLLALAGVAGLGQSVLTDLRDAADLPDLTVGERTSIALGAVALGDDGLARSIERDLLATGGRRLGPWVRLDTGSPDDDAVLTARLAIVAASLGDPLAADMDAWLAANPPATTTVALERALAARGWARRVAGETAVAAMTVDGTRREVTVEPGSPVTVALTPAQAADAGLEPVSGDVLVVTTRDTAFEAGSVTPAADQKLERVVIPSGTFGLTTTVVVALHVTLGPDARDECWRVVDLVPSGLAPIGGSGTNNGDEEDWVDQPPGTAQSPDTVDGQRVEFCVMPDVKRPTQTIRYVARVVNPGTYLWEPAVLQSTVVPGQGVAIAPTTISIHGASGQ